MATPGAASRPICAHAVRQGVPDATTGTCDASGAYAVGVVLRGGCFRVAMTGWSTQPGTRGLNVVSSWHRTPGIMPLCSQYMRKGATYPSEFAQRAPRRMIMRRKSRLEPQKGLLSAKNRPFGPFWAQIAGFARLSRSKSTCTITLWVASILPAAMFDATPTAPDKPIIPLVGAFSIPHSQPLCHYGSSHDQ